MRGIVDNQIRFVALTPEDVVPTDHPIRRIKTIVDEALLKMGPVFETIYASGGRPSIPPERLVKAMLLLALYSVRSERQLCERMRYDLLFRWFCELDIDDEIFDASTFSKNRQRLIVADVTSKFFAEIVAAARAAKLLSQEHFSVDGTLLDAWASQKSVRAKDESESDRPDLSNNDWVDFSGTKRSNDTHASITDPAALLAKKARGQEARPRYCGHVVIENRNGMVVETGLSQATGTAERDVATELLDSPGRTKRATVAGDAGYNTKDFVNNCRQAGITPHVADKKHGAIDERTMRHVGYDISQRRRKVVEQVFGWAKTVGGTRKLRFKGVERNSEQWIVAMSAYNLVRMAKLLPKPT